ncbi:hypothetical protein EXIGLDRAFT_769304 [Exidia glandulosa HHB12029]|uniref:Uncharacterized protein n=1 Tax=Exidia glandulosa HHB12029 TaxID=1314781 RepID=A0A165HKV8_EXIGL|nr:hypothetical protein EXIGLDRAFT_769304 [Exidia glandulosa HHB12029]
MGARTNYLRAFSGVAIQRSISISGGNLRTFIDPAFLAMACRNLSHVTSVETSLWMFQGIRLRLSAEQGPSLTIEEQLRKEWYDHAADFVQLFGLLESVSNKIYSSLRAVTFSLLTWDLWAALLADKPLFVTAVDKVVVTVPPEASTGDFQCDYCALWFPGISTITVDVDYVHQPPIPLDIIRQILDGVQYGDEDDGRKPVAKLPSEHIEGLQCSAEWATEFAGARYTRWQVVPMKLLLHPYM